MKAETSDLLLSLPVLAVLAAMTLGLIDADSTGARKAQEQFAEAPLHSWLIKQQNQLGQVCDEADRRPVDDWRMDGKSYLVTIDGRAFSVPPEDVVLGPNLLGRAIVWTLPRRNIASSDVIRCFMPAKVKQVSFR